MNTSLNNLSPVWTHLSQSVIVRGEGPYLYTNTGQRLLDFTCGIGVTNTGHCHPRVVEAIQQQAQNLIFGQMNCVISEPVLKLTDTLRPLLPKSLDSFFFSNSGAEAVEGAIKLAKAVTGRTNIIAFQGGFHGRTALTMALTGSKTVYRAGFQPLPSGIFFAPFPYAYYYGWDEKTTVAFCLRELQTMLKSQTAPEETAAIIIEPILGEGGYVPAPNAFLKGLRDICDQHGIMLIFDEIQSGFGRAGSWWAHQPSGVTPDIMTLAKGIASGMPLSAIVAPRAHMDKWVPGSHGGTYGGGNAIVMAAAIATIGAIQEDNLIENAQQMGTYLQTRLRDLQKQFDEIGDIRGRGLMIATELGLPGHPNAERAKAIGSACEKAGLLLLTCGTYGNVIRWIPPLIVTKDHIDEALNTFTNAIENTR